jgi:hypothetical protein
MNPISWSVYNKETITEGLTQSEAGIWSDYESKTTATPSISDTKDTLKASIVTYNTLKGGLNDNSKYGFNSTHSIIKKENEDTVSTVLQKDLNQLTLYQNSVYITSAIACATLAIALIIIIPSRDNR